MKLSHIWATALKEPGLRSRFSDRYNLAVCAVLLSALGLRVALIAQPLDVLMNRFMADDAFYYLAITKNIWLGNGIVVDPGVPTNGFHPLFVLLFFPIFSILYPLGPAYPVYGSLLMLSLFSVGTGAWIYLLLRDIHSKAAGLLGCLIWVFNPAVLFTSLIGLETSIQVFFVGALLWFLESKLENPARSSREGVVVGILVAVIFLARMDGVLFGIGISATMAFRELRQNVPKSLNLAWDQFKGMITSGVTALLFVSPWLLWSWVSLGRVTPISGVATRFHSEFVGTAYEQVVFHALHESASSSKYFYTMEGSILNNVQSPALWISVFLTVLVTLIVVSLYGSLPGIITKYDIVIAVAFGIHLVIWQALDLGFWHYEYIQILSIGIVLALPEFYDVATILTVVSSVGLFWILRERDIWHLDYLVVGTGCLYSFYWFHQFRFRPWYHMLLFLYLTVITALVLTEVVRTLSETISKRAKRESLGQTLHHACYVLIVIILMVSFTSAGAAEYEEGNYSHEVSKLNAAQYVQSEVPTSVTVGSFNSGIYQYFLREHEVVNLDGVVNPEAYRARKRDEVSQYICASEIGIFIDPPGELKKIKSDQIKTTLLREFTIPNRPRYAGGGYPHNVYRLYCRQN